MSLAGVQQKRPDFWIRTKTGFLKLSLVKANPTELKCRLAPKLDFFMYQTIIEGKHRAARVSIAERVSGVCLVKGKTPRNVLKKLNRFFLKQDKAFTEFLIDCIQRGDVCPPYIHLTGGTHLREGQSVTYWVIKDGATEGRAALILKVWNKDNVNLAVFPNGNFDKGLLDPRQPDKEVYLFEEAHCLALMPMWITTVSMGTLPGQFSEIGSGVEFGAGPVDIDKAVPAFEHEAKAEEAARAKASVEGIAPCMLAEGSCDMQGDCQIHPDDCDKGNTLEQAEAEAEAIEHNAKVEACRVCGGHGQCDSTPDVCVILNPKEGEPVEISNDVILCKVCAIAGACKRYLEGNPCPGFRGLPNPQDEAKAEETYLDKRDRAEQYEETEPDLDKAAAILDAEYAGLDAKDAEDHEAGSGMGAGDAGESA